MMSLRENIFHVESRDAFAKSERKGETYVWDQSFLRHTANFSKPPVPWLLTRRAFFFRTGRKLRTLHFSARLSPFCGTWTSFVRPAILLYKRISVLPRSYVRILRAIARGKVISATSPDCSLNKHASGIRTIKQFIQIKTWCSIYIRVR